MGLRYIFLISSLCLPTIDWKERLVYQSRSCSEWYLFVSFTDNESHASFNVHKCISPLYHTIFAASLHKHQSDSVKVWPLFLFPVFSPTPEIDVIRTISFFPITHRAARVRHLAFLRSQNNYNKLVSVLFLAGSFYNNLHRNLPQLWCINRKERFTCGGVFFSSEFLGCVILCGGL